MKTLTLVVAAGLAFAGNAPAQVATMDEGSFTITLNGDRVGREDFRIRSTPGTNGPEVVATANVSYTIPIGAAPTAERGRPGAGGGGRPGGRGGGRQKGITLSVSAQNLTNRSNYSGFSGVMTSPYFMQATSVSNPRQIDLSLRLNF